MSPAFGGSRNSDLFWCLLPDFHPGMLHAQWGTGGFAARLIFPAIDARNVATRQLRPQMLADSQKHAILLQPPCQHPYYLLPLVLYRLGYLAQARSWMRWVLHRHAMLRQSLCGNTASVGGGGRVELAGDPGNAVFSSAVCLKGVR